MCAIFGFSGIKNRILLEKMSNALWHRGPDSKGTWESEECSMGLDRLAILDIDGGMQPCAYKHVVSVMNGEIYNFKELRRKLEGLGYVFKSDHSDAELIPAAYMEWGLDFVNHLNGMFAIAIWNTNTKELILIRDFTGKKPCYYSVRGGEVYFASEIKALLAAGFGTGISKKAVVSFLAKKSVEAPLSIYDDIKQIRPASIVVFKNGVIIDEINYWAPRFDGSLQLANDEEYVSLIVNQLMLSVKNRCDMDVEFGSFLSGGLDSSLITTLTAMNSSKKLKTFTLVYEDDIHGKSDDEKFAAIVADRIGADRYIYRLGHEEVWSSMPAVLSAFDEPFSATISPYFLCSLVSRYVKVALCGDGADELFGSYFTHRHSAELDSDDVLDSDNTEWRKKLLVFNGSELSEMFGIHTTATPLREAGEYATTQLHKTLESEFLDQFPNQVLKYADRLSMAHSVEVRSPFLDKDFIELAGHIPSDIKIKNKEVKYILKKAALRFLPHELVYRPKEGFVLPIWKWMDTVWKERIKKTLLLSDISSDFGIRKEYIDRIVKEWEGGAPHHAKIWSLSVLSIWNRDRKNALK